MKHQLMKGLCCAGIALASFVTSVSAQDDHASVKLYVDGGRLDSSILSSSARQRIVTRITQWINETGIAEAGYSNFFVLPTFHVLNTSKDVAGMTAVYLKECELSLTVERRKYGASGSATFNTITKSLVGSGTSEQDALINAVSNLSGLDGAFTGFIRQTKEKISAYFRDHCKDVIEDANMAYGFGAFGQSIALFFSVPSDAPCYSEAKKGLEKSYKKFVEYDCDMKLIRLKAYVARAQTTDSVMSLREYNDALDVIENLEPASTQCFAEAEQIIAKIEGRFNESQKHDWELKKKQATDAVELQKIMFKTIAEISRNTAPVPTVVIAH